MLMSATLPAKSSCSGSNSFFQDAADGGTADLQPATNFGFADARPVELTHLVGVEASGHRPPQALAVLASVRPQRLARLRFQFDFEFHCHLATAERAAVLAEHQVWAYLPPLRT